MAKVPLNALMSQKGLNHKENISNNNNKFKRINFEMFGKNL